MTRHEALAIVLAGILAVGAFGGTAFGVAATTAGTAPTATDGTPTDVHDGGDAQNDTVSLVEAMEAAANETADRNGTVVGAERGQTDGLLDFDDDDENVYTVDVLLADGTHIEVAVDATNGTVVDSDEEEQGFLEAVFGDDDVPDEPLNLSAMYNATEAVLLAQNETDVNGTVTEVELDERDDALVYEVEFERADDEELTVVVAAMRGGDGVVETETDDE